MLGIKLPVIYLASPTACGSAKSLPLEIGFGIQVPICSSSTFDQVRVARTLFLNLPCSLSAALELSILSLFLASAG
jgi:hypothetical protein